jgi:hypothetical protein
MITRYYWWLCTRDEKGKPYLVFGSEKSEDDARQKGMELLGGLDFEIKRLPTRSLPKASSLCKGNRLEQYHNLKEASKRLGHEKSVARLKRRKLKWQDGTHW